MAAGLYAAREAEMAYEQTGPPTRGLLYTYQVGRMALRARYQTKPAPFPLYMRKCAFTNSRSFSPHSNIEHLNFLTLYYMLWLSLLWKFKFLHSEQFLLEFPLLWRFRSCMGHFCPRTPVLPFGTDLDRCFDDSSTKSRQQQTTPTTK